MFSFNVNAPVFTPKIRLPIFNDGKLGAVRILDSEEYFAEFLHEFNPDDVADEDLFNPAVFPVSARDHEELVAAEAFNQEMAELEDLEHQEELRSLLQDRIEALQHGARHPRPAKITSIPGGVFSAVGSRGTQSFRLKGKLHTSRKSRHNINQPRSGSTNH
ncbi:unnamed protein product [Ascophyllum nodosum]